MNTPILLTASGFDELKAELADLNDNRRPAVVSRLALARSMGDLSENSDYISAKEELSFMDGRIAELEDLIRNAQVVSPSKDGSVGIGHIVTVQVGPTKANFKIVGEWEANPAEKKISHSSPLGQALMGKKIGEKVEVEAPAGKLLYTIVGIE